MKYSIQTLNKISKAGTDRFCDAYTISDDAKDPDAILVRSASLHDTSFGDNLKAIARAGAGVNNIPLDRCSEAGICVFNTPGANANAVKELVLTGLLISSRKIPEAMAWAATLKDGETSVAKQVEKGKTLGIIGLGAIGALVANAAVALGMKVVGTDPFLSVGAALRLDPSITVVKTQDDVFAAADYLTIHVPFNKDTEGMINAATIAKMKDGVRVLNYARGELVNDEDMIAALESGKVAYYCTDFPNAKTCNAKHIIATPHLGASTPESEDNCASMAADELMAYLEQGDIRNSVNLPNAQLQAVYTKVCVIHRNVPAMISALTSVIGEAGANIENMTNASKKDYAYTILDIDGVTDGMIEALTAIDGVLRVRVIEK